MALLTTIVLLGLTLLALAVVRDAGASGAQASAGRSVDINHFAFHPGTLRVGKGARVAFTNSSGVTHTATRAGSFDTGRIKPGKTVVVRFTHKGTFAYHCSIHPFMKGKIVVE
ncbi:MAG: plastocyanin/azurin family copper-binding protein [Methanosarcina sp.]